MYNFIKSINTDWKITLDDISKIEEKYEIQFPEKLIEFLIDFNGAEIYESRVTNNNISYGMVALNPIKYGDLPVEQIMEWDKSDQIIKLGLIPIANDRGGNTYYVDSTNGEVLFYYSDDIENPRVVSPDFDSFISNIKVFTE